MGRSRQINRHAQKQYKNNKNKNKRRQKKWRKRSDQPPVSCRLHPLPPRVQSCESRCSSDETEALSLGVVTPLTCSCKGGGRMGREALSLGRALRRAAGANAGGARRRPRPASQRLGGRSGVRRRGWPPWRPPGGRTNPSPSPSPSPNRNPIPIPIPRCATPPCVEGASSWRSPTHQAAAARAAAARATAVRAAAARGGQYGAVAKRPPRPASRRRAFPGGLGVGLGLGLRARVRVGFGICVRVGARVGVG